MESVGIVQMTSGPEPLENLAFIDIQLKQLTEEGVKLVLTPENSIVFGSKSDYQKHAEVLGSGQLQDALAALARKYRLWLVIGSMPIRSGDSISTTTLVYNSDGDRVCHYDKLHMFDVDVDDQHSRYRESEVFTPGQAVAVVATPVGKLGLTICYDLRFPHLFSLLRDKGAQIISVPAAFTATTGEAHWETLLRARAIETQCWVVAAAQTGKHPCGRETWGHSMIINPWGKITQQTYGEVGTINDEIDHRVTNSVRINMPLLTHARFQSHLKTE